MSDVDCPPRGLSRLVKGPRKVFARSVRDVATATTSQSPKADHASTPTYSRTRTAVNDTQARALGRHADGGPAGGADRWGCGPTVGAAGLRAAGRRPRRALACRGRCAGQ